LRAASHTRFAALRIVTAAALSPREARGILRCKNIAKKPDDSHSDYGPFLECLLAGSAVLAVLSVRPAPPHPRCCWLLLLHLRAVVFLTCCGLVAHSVLYLFQSPRRQAGRQKRGANLRAIHPSSRSWLLTVRRMLFTDSDDCRQKASRPARSRTSGPASLLADRVHRAEYQPAPPRQTMRLAISPGSPHARTYPCGYVSDGRLRWTVSS